MIKEIEIKFRVMSNEALETLEKRAHELFPNSEIQEVLQTNFFFDAPDLCVRKSGINFRLRREDETYIITMKGPSPDKKQFSTAPKLSSRLEFEAIIAKEDALSLLDGRINPIKFVERIDLDDLNMKKTRNHILNLIDQACPQGNLSFIGKFTNCRRILPVVISECSMKLEFDRTRFSDSIVHYEVELEIPGMEYSEKAEAFLVDLFEQCGQTPESERSKSERFYALLTGGASSRVS